MTLNITLSPERFAEIRDGRNREVRHKRNPRIDRYFATKTPTGAKINGQNFEIIGVKKTATEIIIRLAADPGTCKHPPKRLYSWSGRDALGSFTAAVCCLCGAVLHC